MTSVRMDGAVAEAPPVAQCPLRSDPAHCIRIRRSEACASTVTRMRTGPESWRAARAAFSIVGTT